MGVPDGPMVGRFSRVRLQHIWRTSKRGPTEIGYAYFRARRRRKNIADDQPELSESDQLALSGAFDVDDAALADSAALIDRYRRANSFEPRTVRWYLPFFHHVYYGGVYTLLRFADHFARLHGVENHFHCYDVTPLAVRSMSAKVSAAFPALAGSRFTSAAQTRDLPPADAAIATLWSSAYPVLHSRNVKAKFYFVQDHEPQFYPAGAASAMVEESYRFGFPGIVNTPGLAEVYRSYGNPAVSFVPAVDLHRYHPPAEPRAADAPVRVFFYARPKTSRNAFGSGLRALSLLKDVYGSRVDIICAGENWVPSQFGLAGKLRNLGVLQSLDEVAALYRSCDIGLVFMHTKHPSYQPFEFMASGMATVSNLNPATTWLLRDAENCLLTPPLPTPTAQRLGRLVDDAELRARIAAAGLAEVRRYRWEDQIERVWRAITLQDEVFSRRREAAAVTAPRRSEAPRG
jgi:glycosyltransferase involved in cell wall biosynthesis